MNVSRSTSWMGTFLFVLGGLALHPLHASAQTGRRAAAGNVSPADLANGKKLFIANCSRCHGVDAAGGDEGPNLQDALAKIGQPAVASTALKGIQGTGMPSFSTILSAGDASNIAAYIGTLGRGASAAAAGGGDVNRGEAVYNSSGCQKCHTIAGAGGDLGPELTDIGSLRQADKLREALLSPGTDLPMKRAARGLSAPVVAYLMFRAVTKDGHTVEGMRVAENTFNIELQDVDGNLHSFSKLELRSLDPEPGKSFMPSVKGSMSDEDLNALIAYLGSLKGAQ